MNKNEYFLSALKNMYNSVLNIPADVSSEEIRILCAQLIQKAFSSINTQIKGSEYLPYEKGTIFIYNHLSNHPFFTVADQFQITLDSHFISGLLHRYYQNPGVRVTRYSLPEETNHQSYYDRFNYIRVYAKEFIPAGITETTIKSINQNFYAQATEVLKNHTGLILSPEGSSFDSENSPGKFLSGSFKLACSMKEQPLIVPLVMTNFDKLPSDATYKCEIKPPFRLSDYGVTDPKDPKFRQVIQKINQDYKTWVHQLRDEKNNFEEEIKLLIHSVKEKKNANDLVVFYGSSTIRLWKDLDQDFPNLHVLNLGFGGAFIHSLIEHFEALFDVEPPKTIVLYLGGNDLTLGYSAEKIVQKIHEFLQLIYSKFPDTLVFNIGIKPSFERFTAMDTIKKINHLMKKAAQTNPKLEQIDFFEHLINKNKVDSTFFLQDGLHLNRKGYDVLMSLIQKAFHQNNIY